MIGFTMGGLNYVTTVLQARTQGMTLMRMPLSVWGIFMATVLALLAFPALFVSAIMMLLDQIAGHQLLYARRGIEGAATGLLGRQPASIPALCSGIFGHPEVYIVALPAFGIVSDLLARTRARIFSATA